LLGVDRRAARICRYRNQGRFAVLKLVTKELSPMARNVKATATLEPPRVTPETQPRPTTPSTAKRYGETLVASAPGDPVSDWLAAERELREELNGNKPVWQEPWSAA
jgi:hypothetical protein